MALPTALAVFLVTVVLSAAQHEGLVPPPYEGVVPAPYEPIKPEYPPYPPHPDTYNTEVPYDPYGGEVVPPYDPYKGDTGIPPYDDKGVPPYDPYKDTPDPYIPAPQPDEYVPDVYPPTPVDPYDGGVIPPYPPTDSYYPVDYGYGHSKLKTLWDMVMTRLADQKAKIAAIIQFRDKTLHSIEKITTLSGAWCRCKYSWLLMISSEYKITSSSVIFYQNVTTLRSGICRRKSVRPSVCRLLSVVCNVRAPCSKG